MTVIHFLKTPFQVFSIPYGLSGVIRTSSASTIAAAPNQGCSCAHVQDKALIRHDSAALKTAPWL
ncbi:hypothetical protein [Acetobacter indonesiensis]|uniref:hypothetical protein n=1 Tax=Acetobacter indonesiensis TaxID=104101 RepID=UPI0020A4FD10|nr:hypothetical protein [Acetobacter indonesiensis]MCP1231884.1 hypothetical protein [Acetobacter indonesiensis]